MTDATVARSEALAARLLDAAISSMETMTVTLGVRLGLYQALAGGDADARALAERAGIHPRYAREWLEQQAVAGVLEVVTEDPDVEPYARVFSLPAAHREVLVDRDSPYYLGTLPGFMVSFAEMIPPLMDAYRSGGGVPYAAYGEQTLRGIAGMNRPMYRQDLAGWVAALPDVHQRMVAGTARVLDLGCGAGASTIVLAEQFPAAQVHGVDLDAASVTEARRAAAEAGLTDRITFTQGDAAASTPAGGYDLICVFEALHDIADPVAALRAARAALAPGGAVLIADERVAEHFAAPGDQLERLNYGFSTLHCLPATRAEGTGVEAGTVLRPQTVREYAEKAGLAFQVLPVEHDMWRFYRLDPA